MSRTDGWLKLNFASWVIRQTRSLGALVLYSPCNMVIVSLRCGCWYSAPQVYDRPFARVLYLFLMKYIGWWLPWMLPGSYYTKYDLLTGLHAAELMLSHWKLSARWSRTSHATIDLRSRHRINPRPTALCRARPMKVDDGLDDIMGICGLGRGRLPAASYALFQPDKRGIIFAIGEGAIAFVICFLHISNQMCLYQTPSRRLPRITDRVVNTVTRGWVADPNERAPFRFHDAVVGFVDRCLSRTRNLAASK